MIKIKVNGREIGFYKQTVMDLLVQYRMEPEKIVLKKNGEDVPAESFQTETLKEGDVVEIDRYVGMG